MKLFEDRTVVIPLSGEEQYHQFIHIVNDLGYEKSAGEEAQPGSPSDNYAILYDAERWATYKNAQNTLDHKTFADSKDFISWYKKTPTDFKELVFRYKLSQKTVLVELGTPKEIEKFEARAEELGYGKGYSNHPIKIGKIYGKTHRGGTLGTYQLLDGSPGQRDKVDIILSLENFCAGNWSRESSSANKMRFKTRQEFEEEFGESWRDKKDGLWWPKSMDYLLGLPWNKTGSLLEIYPELRTTRGRFTIVDWMLTDAPHPYEGMTIVVPLGSKESRDKFVKYALALGYKQNSGDPHDYQYGKVYGKDAIGGREGYFNTLGQSTDRWAEPGSVEISLDMFSHGELSSDIDDPRKRVKALTEELEQEKARSAAITRGKDAIIISQNGRLDQLVAERDKLRQELEKRTITTPRWEGYEITDIEEDIFVRLIKTFKSLGLRCPKEIEIPRGGSVVICAGEICASDLVPARDKISAKSFLNVVKSQRRTS